MGAIEAGLVGPDRDVQHRRGLGIGETQVVVDDEDGAMLGRQAREAALELVSIGERAGRVVDAGRLDRVDVDSIGPRLARRSSW